MEEDFTIEISASKKAQLPQTLLVWHMAANIRSQLQVLHKMSSRIKLQTRIKQPTPFQTIMHQAWQVFMVEKVCLPHQIFNSNKMVVQMQNTPWSKKWVPIWWNSFSPCWQKTDRSLSDIVDKTITCWTQWAISQWLMAIHLGSCIIRLSKLLWLHSQPHLEVDHHRHELSCSHRPKRHSWCKDQEVKPLLRIATLQMRPKLWHRQSQLDSKERPVDRKEMHLGQCRARKIWIWQKQPKTSCLRKELQQLAKFCLQNCLPVGLCRRRSTL